MFQREKPDLCLQMVCNSASLQHTKSARAKHDTGESSSPHEPKHKVQNATSNEETEKPNLDINVKNTLPNTGLDCMHILCMERMLAQKLYRDYLLMRRNSIMSEIAKRQIHHSDAQGNEFLFGSRTDLSFSEKGPYVRTFMR